MLGNGTPSSGPVDSALPPRKSKLRMRKRLASSGRSGPTICDHQPCRGSSVRHTRRCAEMPPRAHTTGAFAGPAIRHATRMPESLPPWYREISPGTSRMPSRITRSRTSEGATGAMRPATGSILAFMSESTPQYPHGFTEFLRSACRIPAGLSRPSPGLHERQAMRPRGPLICPFQRRPNRRLRVQELAPFQGG